MTRHSFFFNTAAVRDYIYDLRYIVYIYRTLILFTKENSKLYAYTTRYVKQIILYVKMIRRRFCAYIQDIDSLKKKKKIQLTLKRGEQNGRRVRKYIYWLQQLIQLWHI